MRKLILDRLPVQYNEGLFWGNGCMGSLLYIRDNRVCFSLDHIALWETRDCYDEYPSGTFLDFQNDSEAFLQGRFFQPMDSKSQVFSTKLPALSLSLNTKSEIMGFHGDLLLENGVSHLKISLKTGELISLRIWLDANVNVLVIETDPNEVSVSLAGWDYTRGNLSVLDSWGYSRYEMLSDGCFSHVLQPYSGNGLAVASVLRTESSIHVTLNSHMDSAPDAQTMIQSNKDLLHAYTRNISRFFLAHENTWTQFWTRSQVSIPDQDLQLAYDIELYKIFSNLRDNSSPVTLMGIWNNDERMPAWCGDWHNDLNVQACYWAVYKTNHAELACSYIDYYTSCMPHFEERAWKLYGIQNAVQCPVMMGPGGHATLGEWGLWGCLPGADLFVATDFIWYYEFTRDFDRLRRAVFPFLEKVIRLYRGIASEGADGFLHIPFTNSPEIVENNRLLLGDDSTFFLSALHHCLDHAIEYASVLGKDATPFQDFKGKLVPVCTTKRGYPLFPELDPFYSHRHFCHLYPIFPLGTDVHSESANNSLDTVVNLGLTGYAGWSFPYLSIFASRCGRGNMAEMMLQIYCRAFRSRNSFCVNGDPYRSGILTVSDNSAGESSDVFTLEAGFILVTAVTEMFVHRAQRDVYIGFGIPDRWKSCSCENLMIEGGHTVSVIMEDYRVKRVRIHGECQEKLVFHLPYSDCSLRLNGISAGNYNGVEIQLEKGKQYVLEILKQYL